MERRARSWLTAASCHNLHPRVCIWWDGIVKEPALSAVCLCACVYVCLCTVRTEYSVLRTESYSAAP